MSSHQFGKNTVDNGIGLTHFKRSDQIGLKDQLFHEFNNSI